jgi:hypothetical protein
MTLPKARLERSRVSCCSRSTSSLACHSTLDPGLCGW